MSKGSTTSRRDFVALLLTILGGAATPAPLAANAQRPLMRRLGVLFVYGEDHPEVPALVGALKEGLRGHGWIEGQTIQMEFRFCRSDANLVKRYTDELVGLKPDVIFAQGVVGAAAMKQATQTIPVVFVRVMPIINPDNRPRWNGYTAAFERYAPALAIRPQMAGIHNENDIEREIAQFAAQPNGGLVVLPDATTGVHAKFIINLAERHRLPAVYSYGFYARIGGLVAYSDSSWGQFQSAASYIDRILRGAKPSELPIQATDRFETVINLKTAKALGLGIPPTLLALADEVIE
jgi:putative tryptophan/tyrosine transport system substrate-binding protein